MRRLTRWAVPTLALLGTTIAVAAALVPAAAGDTPSGNFVIGDTTLTRSNHVFFWGAQWWKNNEVSASTWEPSFKGYAVSLDGSTCTFTSRPGNSTPPPDALTGDTITVLVTSKVEKDGPVIHGTVVGLAQVDVDPGYDDNPGHEATGTVVSYSPCSVGGSGGGDL
jgi:hypothetical protein